MKTSTILFFIGLFFIFLPLKSKSQHDKSYEEKMQWFEDAKLGIFIHWGIYAVEGITESWSFYNGEISHANYLKQRDGFTASNYDPDHWAELIKKSGAKYAVITSKHHDGFALWDSEYGNLNAVDHSKAKFDVLSPFVSALKKNNLKTGLYFSLPDWSSDLYTHHLRDSFRYQIQNEPNRWHDYQKYFMGQLTELKTQYDPDLWWFDGDWEHNAKEWDVPSIKSMLLANRENVIFNSRLNGQGDYETPEIGIPVSRPDKRYWELCMTMNDSWGYQAKDQNYKSSQQIIDILVDCISKGGNLLLDIGPKADGQIPDKQIKILEELGYWTAKHEEAIYGSRRGIPYDYFYGPTALSKDSSTLYLFVRDIPKDRKIVLKGVSNTIENISVIGHDVDLDKEIFCKVSWNTYPGIYYIDLPEELQDKFYTVVAIKLKDKIQLYEHK